MTIDKYHRLWCIEQKALVVFLVKDYKILYVANNFSEHGQFSLLKDDVVIRSCQSLEVLVDYILSTV